MNNAMIDDHFCHNYIDINTNLSLITKKPGCLTNSKMLRYVFIYFLPIYVFFFIPQRIWPVIVA